MSSAKIDELCDRFEAAWRAGRGPRVEEFVDDLSGTIHEEVLRELLFIDHEYRCRTKDPPSEEEYKNRFPDHEELIDEVLAAGLGHRSNTRIEMTGNHKGAATVHEGKRAIDTRLEDAIPVELSQLEPRKLLGDYLLIEELGRGGMGIVYRAKQRSVGRFVALKVLRRDKLEELSPSMRETMIERFRTESMSAAQLEHDNIVQVFEVGEVDGQHYYSMRLVDGESLGDLIKDHPLDNRKAAEFIEPVARALDTAHREGILHRDIKPRNIIIDRKSQRPLVADFGLAKLLEGERDVTHTGDVMGSPPYMSPEQAVDAARVTAATDIYALGATLYHLLVGRPPFQAASVAETLRQVLYDEPTPPRQLNSAIDQDLETICLKCLEKEASRRFSTAGEMAAELTRFLRGEPIQSRPIGLAGRFRRWCHRNPTIASLISAVAALLFVVAVVSAIGYARVSFALREKERVLKEKDAVLSLGVDVVDRFTDLATKDGGLKTAPGMEELRRDFLIASREYYDKFVQQKHGDRNLEVQRGKAYGRLADIEADLGHQQEATELYEQAVDVFRSLSNEYPAESEYVRLRAAYQTSLAAMLRENGERERAERELNEIFVVARKLAERHPGDVPFQALLAHSYQELGILYRDDRRRDDAEKSWRSAAELLTWITEQPGNKVDPNHWHELAKCHNNLALLYKSQGRTDEAVREYAAAMAIWEKLSGDHPEASIYIDGLATCQYNLGMFYVAAREYEEADPLLNAAQRLRSLLLKKHPELPHYKNELAISDDGLGQFYQDQGKFEEAVSAFRDSLILREELHAKFHFVPQYRVMLALSHINLGYLFREHERFIESEHSFRLALDILQDLVEDVPDEPEYQIHLAGAQHSLAVVLNLAGDADGAAENIHDALKLRRKLVVENPDDDSLVDSLCGSLAVAGDVAEMQGHVPEAVAAYDEVIRLRETLVNKQKGNGDHVPLRLSLAESYRRRATLLDGERLLEPAVASLTASSKLLQQLLNYEHTGPVAKELLQAVLARRSQILDELGRHREAVADWDEMLKLDAGSQTTLFTLRRAVSLARSGDHRQAAEIASASVADHGEKPTMLYQAACVFSRAAEAAEQDRVLSGEQQKQLTAQYLAAGKDAMTRLQKSGELGTGISWQQLQGDPDLQRLRHFEPASGVFHAPAEPPSSEPPKNLPDERNSSNQPPAAT